MTLSINVRAKKPLSPERRKRVAETCLPGESIASIASWRPEENLYDKDKLTQTTARMIEERKKAYRETITMPNPDFGIVNNDWQQHMERLNAAQATGDTNAIEVLLSELLEKSDG